jgi:hypothetical protein
VSRAPYTNNQAEQTPSLKRCRKGEYIAEGDTARPLTSSKNGALALESENENKFQKLFQAKDYNTPS